MSTLFTPAHPHGRALHRTLLALLAGLTPCC